MNTKLLANGLLIIAALIAFSLLVLISNPELPDTIWRYVVLPSMGIVVILDVIGLILLGSKETTISFKPRLRIGLSNYIKKTLVLYVFKLGVSLKESFKKITE